MVQSNTALAKFQVLQAIFITIQSTVSLKHLK